MQALLGFLFFSILFSTVTCLECETCSASAKTCTGNNVTCTADQATCATTLTETITGEEEQANYRIEKSCSQTGGCNTTTKTSGDGYSITTTIKCTALRPTTTTTTTTTTTKTTTTTTTTSKPGSSASSISAASLLLGLSGLLLMKNLLE